MARDPKSKHYDAGGIETLDVIKAKLTHEQFKGYLLGNIMKYSLRANHKDSFERDVEKIGYYQRELDRLVAPQSVSVPSISPGPVIDIERIEKWDWPALSKAKLFEDCERLESTYEDEHRKKLNAAGFHPDYVKYGGL